MTLPVATQWWPAFSIDSQLHKWQINCYIVQVPSAAAEAAVQAPLLRQPEAADSWNEKVHSALEAADLLQVQAPWPWTAYNRGWSPGSAILISFAFHETNKAHGTEGGGGCSCTPNSTSATTFSAPPPVYQAVYAGDSLQSI